MVVVMGLSQTKSSFIFEGRKKIRSLSSSRLKIEKKRVGRRTLMSQMIVEKK